MQVAGAAFLAPSVQRVVVPLSLERSAPHVATSRPNDNAAHGALATGVLLGAFAAVGNVAQRTKVRRRQGPPATTLEPKEDVKEDTWGEKFLWQKAWYPMAVVEDLDGTRPTKLQLLGEDLVAWVDGDGEWRVFEDRCPHRAVPLSEGRVEKDGTLMCSYHGWRFNGEGKLTALPQAPEGKLPELQKNARACAASRPAQVRCGVLWVWGESGEDAALEAALQEPNIPPEAEDPAFKGRAKFSVWSHRDVPYGWEVAFENVTDPAHVAVAHHNIVSNRYEDPCPLKIDFVRKPTNKGGFKYSIEQVGKNVVTTMDFKPPSQMHIRSSYDEKSGAALYLIINFVPTKPGWSKLVGSTLIITGENGEKPDGFALYSAPLPRWLVHLTGPLFLHQDQVFLHFQQSILEKEKRKHNNDWMQSYWMPTESDKGTITLRRWLDKNGGIAWSPGVDTDLAAMPDKQMLFDTYKTHTSQCTTCQKALRWTNRLNKFFKYSAVVCTTAGIAGTVSWPLLASGAALGGATWASGKVRQMFYEVPFHHQDND